MTSHHVICHVTAVTYLFIINKRRRNSKEKKYKIKKNLVLTHIITLFVFSIFVPGTYFKVKLNPDKYNA